MGSKEAPVASIPCFTGVVSLSQWLVFGMVRDLPHCVGTLWGPPLGLLDLNPMREKAQSDAQARIEPGSLDPKQSASSPTKPLDS